MHPSSSITGTLTAETIFLSNGHASCKLILETNSDLPTPRFEIVAPRIPIPSLGCSVTCRGVRCCFHEKDELPLIIAMTVASTVTQASDNTVAPAVEAILPVANSKRPHEYGPSLVCDIERIGCLVHTDGVPAFLVAARTSSLPTRSLIITICGTRYLHLYRLLVPNARYKFTGASASDLERYTLAGEEFFPAGLRIDDLCEVTIDELPSIVGTHTPATFSEDVQLRLVRKCVKGSKLLLSAADDTCITPYLPLRDFVSYEGTVTSCGLDWIEFDGDSRCTIWFTHVNVQELLPRRLFVGDTIVCYGVHSLQVRCQHVGLFACTSTLVSITIIEI